MSKKRLSHTEAEVKIGTSEVAIKRKGRSEHATAVILGREAHDDGTESIWLDRLVHATSEDAIGGKDCPVYAVSGAFVSVLRSRLPADQHVV